MARIANSDAAVTRTRIVDAALDLFAEQGFHGTSMREIASAAGLTGGSLYHHFDSKEDILLAVVAEIPARTGIAERVQQVLRMANQSAALKPLLTRMCVETMELFKQPFHRKMFRILMNDGLRLAQEGVLPAELLGGTPRAMIAALMSHLMDQGIMRRVDPDYAVMLLMGPMLMYRQIKLVWGMPSVRIMDIPQFIEAHVDGLMQVLAPRGESP
jgi:AcrR family transcriptional regulator